VLWTTVPIETVMEGWGKKDPQLRECALPGGGSVLVDVSSGEERIFRLHSTDPQMFLKPQYAPGQVWSAATAEPVTRA